MEPKNVTPKQGRPRVNARCTNTQKHALIEYMAKHLRLARYELDLVTADAEWQRLADTLNAYGTVKTVEAWKVSWRDLRRKAAKDKRDAIASNRKINVASKKILDIINTDEDPAAADMLNMTYELVLPPGDEFTLPQFFVQDQEEVSLTENYKPNIKSPEPRYTVEESPPSSPVKMSPAHNSGESSESDNEEHDSEEDAENKAKQMRCTPDQKRALVNYMAQHPALATSHMRPHECDCYTDQWQHLNTYLNKMGNAKTAESWKRTWRDLRGKASKDEKKALASNSEIDETSKKILDILASYNPTLEDRLAVRKPPQLSKSTHYKQDQEQKQEISKSAQIVTRDRESPRDLEDRSSPASELESLEDTYESSTDSSPCSSPTPNNKIRCTKDQINTLVDCMALNPSMAFGRRDIPKNNSDWRRLRQLLNTMGPAKRTTRWLATWRDLKRVALTSTQVKSSSSKPTTKKILEILAAQKERMKNNPQELSADVTESLQPPNGLSTVPQYFPPSPPRIASPKDTGLNTEKYKPKKSPARRSGVNMRSTKAQIYALVDYMAQHPTLARSSYKAVFDPHLAEWRQLSKYINKLGTAKTVDSWKRIKVSITEMAGRPPGCVLLPTLKIVNDVNQQDEMEKKRWQAFAWQ